MRLSKAISLTTLTMAMLVMPALAAAGEWKAHPAPNGFSTNILGTVLRTSTLQVNCGASTGAGKLTSETAGEIAMLFHSCQVIGLPCTTTGQSSGTVTLQAGFSLVYLAGKARGIRLTGVGEGKKFSEFSCAGVPVVVTGDLIGEVTAPTCNGSSKSLSVKFVAAEPGVQQQMQITGTGTKYDLTATVSGTPATASQEFGGTLNFEKTLTMTCP
jgi:hypothetical protein